MQEPLDIKMFFYFDESGSPAILGHHGKNLLEKGLTSKTFSVGYVQTANPRELFENLNKLKQEIQEDEYLRDIPSIKILRTAFMPTKIVTKSGKGSLNC